MDGDGVAGNGAAGWRTSRRVLLEAGLVGGAAVAASVLPAEHGSPASEAATIPTVARSSSFNRGWLFGREYVSGAARSGYDDSGFTPVTLPHTVVPLSWGGWDPDTWQKVWIYRRRFDGSQLVGRRVFVDFDGVMVNAVAVLNDVVIGSHRGGYLPWSVELTGELVPGGNVLAIVVDSRCLAVPPVAPRHGPASIDYLQPGGLYRDAYLRVVPQVHLADVSATPRNVLRPNRWVQVACTVDAALGPVPTRLTVKLLDGARQLASATRTVNVHSGVSTVRLALTDLGPVGLWSPDQPRLYTLQASLSAVTGTDTVTRRIGFREASFRPDGFYLNGERLKIFGLNRHQLFPYLGMAAPARLQHRDAEILRQELNCNMVRCSHYPQSPHFLDACDELGLMVWEEAPGWQQIGDDAWQDLVVQNVRDMVVRDRSRPSVVIWGTRLDETPNNRDLYARTRRLAHSLDGSRPTSGATLRHTTTGWADDVYGFDDYHSNAGNAVLRPPLPGIPYLVTEAVGALDGPRTYRWTDPPATLVAQARLHAQVHHLAGLDPHYAGLLAWAGIDYASHNGGARIWHALKTPGVLDTFRIAKPGAAVYQSQVDPAVRPVVLPAFYWDFGPGSPQGPGQDAMIATNCDRLEIYVVDRWVATAVPDAARYAGLAHPPAFADLSLSRLGIGAVALTGRPGGTGAAAAPPDLRIDGYRDDVRVATLLMSADTTRDRLALTIDHTEIRADGSDATRVTFRAVDVYGNHRPGVTGAVTLALSGPAVLLGDNPFRFDEYGAAGGAVIRSLPGRTGPVIVTAYHPALGTASASLTSAVQPPGGGTVK
ncbi:MAG: beta-galactosidase [Micromonosporaceae bacterium]|nr:beta-galactosidase [Micromonosporaceae bacterium]